MVDVESTINERERTHGRYRESAALCQTFKAVLRAHTIKSSLTPYQLEALDMILFKIARAVCGDPGHADHWRDIAGYAMLVLKEIGK